MCIRDSIKANLGCCLMDRSIVRVEASPGIYVREHVYDVTIAPGIDPVLMIGLTIFIGGPERLWQARGGGI